MKKRSKMRVFGVLAVLALALVAWDRNEMSIYQLRVNTLRGNNDTDAITIVNPVSFTGEATVDGKYAVTGGDATTGLMVQKAAITATAATLQTNSFAVTFGAVPTVMCTYTEDPGDVRPIFVTTVTASNFIASVTADKNFAYVAVGTRP